MKTFLIAVAGVVVGLLLVAALAWLWLKRKLRGVGEALGALVAQMAGVPPFRIHLQPLNVAPWKNGDDVLTASRSFEQVGYERAGDFEVEEMEDVLLRGFWHPQWRSYAVVYDHPQVGVSADVVGLHTDRSILTISSAPETGLDRPARARLVRVEVPEPSQVHRLHERLVSETGDRTPIATRSADFARAMEGAYRMEQDWRIARGGVTSDEIRRAAAAGGLEPPDDTAVEIVRQTWRGAIDAFLTEQILDAWLASNPMPASEWEQQRGRIRVIHDQADPDDLASELAWRMIAGSYDPEDDEAGERAHEEAKARLAPVFSGSACAGFAEAQHLLPEKHRYRKLGAVTQPFAGDLYLEPELEA